MRTVGERHRVNATQTLTGRLLRYAPLIFWLGLIFYASTGDFSAENTSRFIGPLMHWLFPDISAQKMQLVHMIVRKTAHFGGYAVLGILAARAFCSSTRRWLWSRWFVWSVVLIIAYAMVDEYHQSFIPTRTGSPVDALIDITGGLAALVLFRALKLDQRLGASARRSFVQ